MSNRSANFLLRYWRGEARLWRAFWVFGAFIQATVWFVTFGMMPGSAAPGVLVYAGWGLTLGYSLWASVAVWRCAFNTAWRPWGYLARGFAVGWFLAVLASFVLFVWLAVSLEGAFEGWDQLD